MSLSDPVIRDVVVNIFTVFVRGVEPNLVRQEADAGSLRIFRALSESLIVPLELKMEEWKKAASQLDKDHAKGRLRPPPPHTASPRPHLRLPVPVQSTRRPEPTSRRSPQTPSSCRRK